ncbi:site-specific integrase [Lactobacillus rhamnosus]|uniref:Site-specific integrase n=1 Tax=Lacticaseibacillus rhamnosus TaxID=47715 RepID=A0A7Y7QHP2_LACRH|nr:tyrosine-type recombinase/integrase [Lacticaseibacillus rhamnosus]NVO88905.1 site-specific integrase [Lacticaseibacillus rhamnosus]
MSVYKRKNRRSKPWIFEWNVTDPTGHRRKKTKSFESEREAKLAEAKYLVNTNGQIQIDSDITFVDYFQLWIDTYKAKSVSANTLTKYATSKNIIKAYFGDMKVKDITRTKYQQFINWYIDDGFGHKHSKQSVEKLHSHAHQAVLSAVDDGYLMKDPGVRAALGGTEGKTEQDKFLEADDFERLRDYTNEFANPSRIALSMVQFAIYTGARISEIEGLTWEDVNEDAETVTINKSFNYHTWYPTRTPSGDVEWPKRATIFLPTKNHEIRTLDVSPILIKSLHRLILAQKVRAKENPYHLVFLGPDGTPPTDNAANKEMRRAMKSLGILKQNANFTFHGLRHSHGSYLLTKGVDLQYVSKRLGHKNLAITMKIYTHTLDRLKKTEAAKAVKVL